MQSAALAQLRPEANRPNSASPDQLPSGPRLFDGDDAEVARLGGGKRTPRNELFVDFSRRDVHIELAAAGIQLAAGDWTWQASVGGQPLESEGTWSEVFRHRQKQCHYLDLELQLSRGWKLKRQALLAREDRFLLLADALIGPEGEGTEIRQSQGFPLVGSGSFQAAKETREGWIESEGQRRATVVPPALAEWRCEFCHSELLSAAGAVQLEQAALGRNLYVPLWIDLDPRRCRRPVTWRRLTVGEDFSSVPRDVAAAYRIQVGREQWLVYRSLAKAGNRSVLGYNTLHSFVCGRIAAGGGVKEILEIE